MTRLVWRIGPSSAGSSVRSSGRSPRAGISIGVCLAAERDADGGRLAVLLGVPLGRNSDQFAVAVAGFSDIGGGPLTEGRVPAWCRLLGLPLDDALIGQAAQHVAEGSAACCSSSRTRGAISRTPALPLCVPM